MNCYSCDLQLTADSESIEHIIPNAIGGRLKSKELLCKSCNSMFGDTIDAELCKQLVVMAGSLNIKRESGNNPIIRNVKSESGQLYHLQNGRNPIPVAPEIKINEEENTIHIGAKDEQELKQILAGLKRKYPTLDDKNLESKMKASKYYLDEALNMKLELGGTKFMKAIIKIAINFYIAKKCDPIYVADRISDIKKIDEIPVSIARHYYSPETMQYIDESEVSHTVLIIGDSSTRRLFAYIELFSSCSFVINLNENYGGSDLRLNYSYDVLKLKEIEKNIVLNYNGSNLIGEPEVLNQEFISNLQTKLNRLFQIADKRQVDEIISEITKEASKNTLKTYPEGTIITKEIIDEFFSAVLKDAAPFIAHLHRKRRRNNI